LLAGAGTTHDPHQKERAAVEVDVDEAEAAEERSPIEGADQPPFYPGIDRVEVDHKGYLFPFGHGTKQVKLTERALLVPDFPFQHVTEQTLP
jgi:hypothetical protein